MQRSCHSFRSSVVILTLCAVIIPLVVISSVLYASNKRNTSVAAGQALETIVNSNAEDVDAWFGRAKHSLKLSTRAPGLVESCRDLDSFPASSPQYKLAFAKTAGTVHLIHQTIQWANEIKLSRLNNGQTIFSTYQLPDFVDQTPTSELMVKPMDNVGSLRLEELDKEAEQSDWLRYRRPTANELARLRSGQILVVQNSPYDFAPKAASEANAKTNTDSSTDDDKQTSFLCSALLGDPHTSDVLISIRITARDIANSLRPNVYIIDKNGYRITTPRRGHFVSLYNWMREKKQQPAPSESVDTIPCKTSDGVPLAPYVEFNAYRHGRPYTTLLMSGYTDLYGEHVIGAWEPTSVGDLCIVAEVSEHELSAPKQETINLSIFISVAIAACFSLFAGWTAESLTNPLAVLSGIANSIASGDRTVRCNWPRSDEIGSFAYTFDIMAETLDMNIAELKVAKENAENANLTKSKFLTHVSSRLSTPLDYIIDTSEKLADDAATMQDGRNYIPDLHKVHTAAQTLSRLINGVLDISRSESGCLTIDSEEFTAAELVDEVNLSITPLTAANHNSYVSTIAHGVPLLNTDRTKLRQILINVIGNALKFTTDGKVTLSITATNPSAAAAPASETHKTPNVAGADTTKTPEPRLYFMVSDTGIGMTPEQCTKVFDEFTQADDSTTRNYGGTGLGLTLVQRLVRLLGGTIEVQSQIDQGTTFIIMLPATAPPTPPCPVNLRRSDANTK